MRGDDAVGKSAEGAHSASGDAHEQSSGGGISRRTVMKGAAWSVPVIMLANAAPAFAASGVINLGNILESSCTIYGPGINQSSMYIAGKDVPGAGNNTRVTLTFTITITYTPPSGSVSDFTLAGTNIISSVYVGAITPIFDTPTTGPQTITFTMDTTYTITGGNTWDSGSGTLGYIANFATGAGTPEPGSITIDAVADGTDEFGNQYHAEGLVMGEPESTTGPMLENGHTIPLVGPDFHKP